MTDTPSKAKAILAVAQRLFGLGQASQDRCPPKGWERRTLHYASGDILVFEAPIDDASPPEGSFAGFHRPVDAVIDARRQRRQADAGTPLPDRPARGTAVDRSDRCELLDAFLKRRAGDA